MNIRVIINDYYGLEFNLQEFDSPKRLELNKKIESIEIEIDEFNSKISPPELYLDPRSNKPQIKLPLKQKFGPFASRLSLDKDELFESIESDSNLYKYIFDLRDSKIPEGYLFFILRLENKKFNFIIHFPFRLINEDQFRVMLDDISQKGTKFFLNPSNLLPDKFILDRNINLDQNVGGRKLYLLSSLMEEIRRYIQEDFVLIGNYDENIDEEIIALESSRYQNKFIKFVLIQTMLIAQELLTEGEGELKEHKDLKDYKLSKGIKSEKYLQSLERMIQELGEKCEVISNYRNEIYYFLKLTIISHTEYIPNILQFVVMVVKQNPLLLNILYYYLMLFYSMQYTLSEKASYISYQTIPEIYEHWVFFKICECLDNLGFHFIGNNKSFYSFSRKLIPETIYFYEMIDKKSQNIKINVVYNRYYETVNKDLGIEYGFPNSRYKRNEEFSKIRKKINYKNKRNPDVALEIFINQSKVPKILIFDATYSLNDEYSREFIFPQKMAYASSFIDFSGNKIGLASWVILPDRKIGPDAELNEYFALEDDRNGALILNPNDSSSLAALQEIIYDNLSYLGIKL